MLADHARWALARLASGGESGRGGEGGGASARAGA